MLFTLLFSAGLFLSLWPYLVMLGVFDFKKNPNTMEKPLPDRPARRTIGRKNEDVAKVISVILFFHFILYGAFYGLIEIQYLLPDALILLIVGVVGATMFYVVTPANRMGHAYLTFGQIAIIHFICSFVAFTVLSLFLYGNHVSFERMMDIGLFVLAAMMIFSKRLEAK